MYIRIYKKVNNNLINLLIVVSLLILSHKSIKITTILMFIRSGHVNEIVKGYWILRL
jgi:hypothetical protein